MRPEINKNDKTSHQVSNEIYPWVEMKWLKFHFISQLQINACAGTCIRFMIKVVGTT
jgi:hypothetical protein